MECATRDRSPAGQGGTCEAALAGERGVMRRWAAVVCRLDRAYPPDHADGRTVIVELTGQGGGRRCLIASGHPSQHRTTTNLTTCPRLSTPKLSPVPPPAPPRCALQPPQANKMATAAAVATQMATSIATAVPLHRCSGRGYSAPPQHSLRRPRGSKVSRRSVVVAAAAAAADTPLYKKVGHGRYCSPRQS